MCLNRSGHCLPESHSAVSQPTGSQTTQAGPGPRALLFLSSWVSNVSCIVLLGLARGMKWLRLALGRLLSISMPKMFPGGSRLLPQGPTKPAKGRVLALQRLEKRLKEAGAASPCNQVPCVCQDWDLDMLDPGQKRAANSAQCCCVALPGSSRPVCLASQLT